MELQLNHLHNMKQPNEPHPKQFEHLSIIKPERDPQKLKVIVGTIHESPETTLKIGAQSIWKTKQLHQRHQQSNETFKQNQHASAMCTISVQTHGTRMNKASSKQFEQFEQSIPIWSQSVTLKNSQAQIVQVALSTARNSLRLVIKGYAIDVQHCWTEI